MMADTQDETWRCEEYNPTEHRDYPKPDAREWEFWSGKGETYSDAILNHTLVSHCTVYTEEARDRILASLAFEARVKAAEGKAALADEWRMLPVLNLLGSHIQLCVLYDALTTHEGEVQR